MIFDLIFLAYFILVCARSAKKGFIRSLIEIIGFVVAAIFAYWLSQPIAQYIYQHFFRPSVVSAIAQQIEQITSAGSIKDQMDIILSAAPPIFHEVAGAFGVSTYSVGTQLSSWLSEGAMPASQAIADGVIGPLITGVSGIFIMFILFILFVILVKAIAKFFDNLIGIITGSFLNKLLGGLLGVCKALFVTLIICNVLSVCVQIADESFTSFFAAQMETSLLFSAVYYSNPFLA